MRPAICVVQWSISQKIEDEGHLRCELVQVTGARRGIGPFQTQQSYSALPFPMVWILNLVCNAFQVKSKLSLDHLAYAYNRLAHIPAIHQPLEQSGCILKTFDTVFGKFERA
jgi:hypothetical protein